MKNIHLRWILHQLDALPKLILKYLNKAKKNNFKFWFEYRNNYKRMWFFDFDERQEIVSSSNIQGKNNGYGICQCRWSSIDRFYTKRE